MKDIDVLFELYKEQRDLGMHHEDQRSTVSGLLLTAATLLIGLIVFDDKVTESDLPVAGVIVFIGIFGCLFTLKNYERFNFHRERSRTRILRLAIDAALRWGELHNNEDKGIRDEIRNALELDPNKSAYLIGSLVKMANNKYRKKEIFLEKADLHKFWVGLHLTVSAIGLLIGLRINSALLCPCP